LFDFILVVDKLLELDGWLTTYHPTPMAATTIRPKITRVEFIMKDNNYFYYTILVLLLKYNYSGTQRLRRWHFLTNSDCSRLLDVY